MGLRPVAGRLIGPADDGPKAAGVACTDLPLLEHVVSARPVGHRQDHPAHDRRATIVGVGTVGSLSDRDRNHRQRGHEPAPHGRDDGGRAGAPDDGSVRPAGARRRSRYCSPELRAVHRSIVSAHPESYSKQADFRIHAVRLRDDCVAGADGPAGAARRVVADLRHRVLERGEPDSRALGPPRRRAGDSRGAWSQPRGAAPDVLAESLLLCGAGASLAVLIAQPMVAVLARYAARFPSALWR